ncbi:MAG: GNAT family N-acetyltransferase [Asgard group archaeon]|nr:GNAT family N-acetyltransferase [Asgard group archaeon]
MIEMFDGELVRLRSYELDDCEYIWKHLNSLTLRAYLGKAIPQSIEETKEWISNTWKWRQDGIRFFFAFEEITTNQLLGSVNLYIDNKISKSASLGIWIYEEKNWEKGYGSDAMIVILKFGFDYLNLHRIGLSVYPANERAIHVYKKLGFKIVGEKRESRFMNGKYKNEILMDILESEWRVLSKKSS